MFFVLKKKKTLDLLCEGKYAGFFFFLNKTITQTKKIVLVFFLLW